MEKNQKIVGVTQKADTKKKVYKRYLTSKVFPDGAIADMVYSPTTGVAQFAFAKQGAVSFYKELLVDENGNMTLDASRAVSGKTVAPSIEARRLMDQRLVHLPTDIEKFDTVDGLFREVRGVIEKYVMLEDSRFYDVSAAYVLMSWVFDRFSVVPYLRVVGDLGTGKSRFLEVVGKMCNRAIVASGSMSMASVYHSIDILQGTLVFDEADFKSSDMTSDFVKLLNGGHKKDSPVVRMDTSGQKLRVQSFRVFGPKVFASRHGFEDTALNSRCIIQRLFPTQELNRIPIHLPSDFEDEVQKIRNKLLLFRLTNHHLIHEDESTVANLGLSRLKQTALALTSVAKVIGTEVLESITAFLQEGEQDLMNDVSTNELADVLFCIAVLVEDDDEVRKSGKLFIGRIAEEFNNRFYDDYTTRLTREVPSKEGAPLMFPGQIVSARKIGVYVERLGLTRERSAKGLFVPIHKEARRISTLVGRYKLVEALEEWRTSETPRTEEEEEFEEDAPKPF